MEIITRGGKLPKYKHRIVCGCGAKIAYKGCDLKLTTDYQKYIICPKCGEIIFIDD